MLTGKGVMVWKLDYIPDAETFAKMMKYYEMDWVSIKMLNGEYPYNWHPGKVDKILGYMDALTNQGIRIGMWQYTDGTKPGPHGSAVGTTIEKFEKRGLSFVQIDAEGGEWNNNWGTNKLANLYCDSLGIPDRIDVSLCSYRYPNYFPKFPFETFLKHRKVRGQASPQVYWEFSHNPVQQLRRSLAEYAELSLSEFVPIAPTYWRGVPGADGSWGPTVDDLAAFRAEIAVLNLGGWGVYSFDKIWQHYEDTGKYPSGADWMEALTGKPAYTEATPPPPPPPGDDTVRVAIVKANRLNVRNAPSTSNVRYPYTQLSKGQMPYVVGPVIWNEGEKRSWAKLGANMYACMRDWDGTELMTWVDA